MTMEIRSVDRMRIADIFSGRFVLAISLTRVNMEGLQMYSGAWSSAESRICARGNACLEASQSQM